MKPTRFALRCALWAALLIPASAAAQQVTLELESLLYAEPRLDSSQVTQLKLGATGGVTGK